MTLVSIIGASYVAEKASEPPLEVSFPSEAHSKQLSEGKLETWERKVEAREREQARSELAIAETERAKELIAEERAEAEREEPAEEEAENEGENKELDAAAASEDNDSIDSSGHGAGESKSGTEAQEGGSAGEEDTSETEPPTDEGNTERSEERTRASQDGTSESEESGENKATPARQGVGTFEATAYTAYCDTGCTGVTASGYDVSSTIYSPEGLRVVAADPGVLPLGTVIEIDSGGSTIQAVVLDTGGNINGNRLDLLVETEAEARSFGRKGVDVRIISE